MSDSKSDDWIKLVTGCDVSKFVADATPNASRREPEKNTMELLFEQKTLREKLNAPKSYRGRDADEARLAELDRLLGPLVQKIVTAPPKPAQDARIVDLLAKTKRELDMIPHTDELDRKINAEMIREYLGIRTQLEDYVKDIDPNVETTKRLGDAHLKAWKEAIYDAGELRRVLAGNVVVNYEEGIRAEQATLKKLGNAQTDLKAKSKRVQADLEQIADAQKWVGHLLKLNDTLELFQEPVKKLSEIGTRLMVAELKDQVKIVADKSDLIKQGIGNLAEYYTQIEVLGTGFASLPELQNAIQRSVEAIRESVGKINWVVRQRDRAQAIYDQAVSEAPKQ